MTNRALLLAAASALVPGAVYAAADALPITADGVHRFAPDTTHFTLTRTQWRTLGDGRQIVVSRDYAVEIVPSGGGFRVDGTLIGTRVDVPAVLEPIARLERARADSGLFPLHLDASGRIVAAAAAEAAPFSAPASSASQQILRQSPLPAASQGEAMAMVERILAASSLAAAWPADLFNPARRERREHQSLALGEGVTGDVSVSVTVEGMRPGAVPDAVERVIVTRIAGNQRSTRERWTMVPN